MKILSVHLENFASYKELDFNFNDKGLVLIHGATGSGKSTLCDAIPWVLFGITAKNGKADDVLSWDGGGTFGTISLEVNGKSAQITRSRKPNDLYFRTENNLDANPSRGKDLNDTQRLINELLGIDADLYLAGAYFHEFSQTAQFFTTTAKNRRDITEQLVDLTLPVKLQDKIKEQNKVNTIEINTLSNKLFTINAKLELLEETAKESKNSNMLWAHEQANRISTLETKRDTFEVSRRSSLKSLELEHSVLKYQSPLNIDLKINEIQKSMPPENAPCKTCGIPGPNPDREYALQALSELKLEKQENDRNIKKSHEITTRINELKDQENPYIQEIIEAKNQTNPHVSQLLRFEKDIDKQQKQLVAALKTLEELKDNQLNLELLSDAVVSFRAELIRNTVKELETMTVSHLRDFFEGEISVEFTIQENDKLDVLIRKDGNECSYTQLSKGQRQMLKLCFGVSVMESIQQSHALEFNQLFFDESLDGMDDNNKLRAVKMLETLASKRDSVYIVEHSEGIKAHIDQKYFVELRDGKSTICLA